MILNGRSLRVLLLWAIKKKTPKRRVRLDSSYSPRLIFHQESSSGASCGQFQLLANESYHLLESVEAKMEQYQGNFTKYPPGGIFFVLGWLSGGIVGKPLIVVVKLRKGYLFLLGWPSRGGFWRVLGGYLVKFPWYCWPGWAFHNYFK